MTNAVQNTAKTKIAIGLNIAIFVMVVGAVVNMFLRVGNGTLATTGFAMFKYYTVDSNILEGVAALVAAVCQIKTLRANSATAGPGATGAATAGNPAALPRWVDTLKLAATACVTLTFLVVLFFLLPIVNFNLAAMYSGSNFFMHFLVPVLAVVTYVAFERPRRRVRRELALCLIPTIAYEIYYGINALTHIVDGKVPLQYDWYHFLVAGPWSMALVAPLILAIEFAIIAAINRVASGKARK